MGSYYQLLPIITRQSLSYTAFSAALFLQSQQIVTAVRSNIIILSVSVCLKSALSFLQFGLFSRAAKQLLTNQNNSVMWCLLHTYCSHNRQMLFWMVVPRKAYYVTSLPAPSIRCHYKTMWTVQLLEMNETEWLKSFTRRNWRFYGKQKKQGSHCCQKFDMTERCNWEWRGKDIFLQNSRQWQAYKNEHFQRQKKSFLNI